MNIHLTVRYRQLHRDFPGLSHHDLVAATVRRMVWPCLYTALTTIIGFGSLVFSGIKPVIDFGWMMSIGLAVTFVTAFTLFPAIVLLLGRSGTPERPGAEQRFTGGLALATERHGALVLAAAGALLVVCALGVSRLTVENSFVDYFSEDTEIYRGLALIDRELGGTTPLEVVLDLDEDRIFDDEPAPKPTGYDAEAERERGRVLVHRVQDRAHQGGPRLARGPAGGPARCSRSPRWSGWARSSTTASRSTASSSPWSTGACPRI